MDRGDDMRPDGITVFPFRNGRSLVWDCTCVDTYAASHLMGAAFEPGSAAGEAEMRKRQKYERLVDAYIFEPVAIETTGVYGPSTTVILKFTGSIPARTTIKKKLMMLLEKLFGFKRNGGSCYK